MLSGPGFQSLECVLYLGLKPLGELLTLEIVKADVAGDGKAGRDGNADHCHLGQAGTLAAENVFHGRSAVGAALPKRIDERLGVRAAHAGVAMSGVAWRSRIGSS